jgi:8-oxo-dGTP pyrophosphatase MutT (NUDIX family)
VSTLGVSFFLEETHTSRSMDPEELARRLQELPAGPVLQESTRHAAVALVLRATTLGTEVLLMRRAEREGDRWSGQIGLPGGHADPGDVDLYATALREAHEEVGVDLAVGARLLGALRPVQAKARGYLLPMWITPFVFHATSELAPVPGPEAVEVFWFPIERAREGELAWTYRYRRGQEERVLPAWRFEERVVWGLTYEILAGFLRLIGQGR